MLFQLHGIIFGDLDFRLGLLYEHLLHRYHLFSNLKTFLFEFMSIFFLFNDLEFNFSSTQTWNANFKISIARYHAMQNSN